MNRKILIRVTAPAVLLGLFLLVACLAGAQYIDRLHTNLTNVLSQSVASSQAAQELEIRVRQLRFRNFLYLVRPSRERLEPIELAQEKFEESLDIVRHSVRDADETAAMHAIEEGYRHYRSEMADLRGHAERLKSGEDWIDLAASHPIDHVVNPCEELVRLNQERMNRSLLESERVSEQARWAMMFLGVCGPLGGIAMGYGVARGLSHSIYRLSVRVQDVAQRLDRDVGSVNVAADGDIQNLDEKLQYIIRRVEEAAESFRQQQRELIRAEQLAAVGQLAAGVAHEIRNPLTGVKLLVDAALRSKNNKPLTEDDLRVIHREIGRLEQTVQGLLDLARLPPPQRTDCDLCAVIREATELVSVRAERQHVALTLQFGADPVVAAVDRGQLHKVMVNLFLNALDGMPQGGVLTVLLDEPPGGVHIAVSDTGAGIAADILPRLFTPFTTTKPTGTGLGLSISRRIVEEHGGKISACNRPKGGACLDITLPRLHK